VAAVAGDVLGVYPLSGDTSPVRDPSLIHVGNTYYAFATDAVDAGQNGNLPIRCSADLMQWSACGYVFAAMPAWVQKAVPGATDLWAPDISYFNHQYHIYYAASTLESQVSVIGLATNTTLDPTSPGYRWVDQGMILSSGPGDNFNALDPNILIDADGSVWLNYGSFWSGIHQRRIEPTTSQLSTTDPAVYDLAAQPSSDHAVEGASMIRSGSYYYLFASTGHCCRANPLDDDYEQIVGRSTSPHGPFLDMAGIDLETGGGTVLLKANSLWNAPGGGTAYLDPATGKSLLVFHALKMGTDPTGYLWHEQITWQNGWPSLH
jgi:arabinan endo-1,5-alpha-L-arabinosidase